MPVVSAGAVEIPPSVVAPVVAPVQAIVASPAVELGSKCSTLYQGKYYSAIVIKVFPDGERVKIKFNKFNYCPIVDIRNLRF